jgi:hypothetical protein
MSLPEQHGIVGCRVTLALLAGAVAFGCDFEHVCTLVGCESSLNVHLEGAMPDTFTVTAKVPERPDSVIQCPQEWGDCRDEEWNGLVWFFGLVVPEVTIEVAWDSFAVTQTFQPEYGVVRPNGPDCPPECRVAGVTLQQSKLRRRHVVSVH